MAEQGGAGEMRTLLRAPAERGNIGRLRRRLRREVGHALRDYRMIEDGDRVMVCLSGGKDSHVLLHILLDLQRSTPVSFELVAVNLDQKQPGFPADVLPRHLQQLGVEFHILERDTYSIVKDIIPEGRTMCGLCSRLRRGILYDFARHIGAHKIALGHHREDIVETLFLNLFYQGRLKAMPPKLLSDDGRNVVIRPLAYCREQDIARYAQLLEFPIIPCNLCGSQEGLQRQRIKSMLQDWERENPGRLKTIFASLRRVSPSQLADTTLFDFASLRATASAPPGEHDLDLTEITAARRPLPPGDGSERHQGETLPLAATPPAASFSAAPPPAPASPGGTP